MGRAIALEVKTAKGKQQPSQVEWASQWNEAGGWYFVVRSAEDTLAALDEVKKGAT
jgi:hypothetical protein